MQEYIVGLNKDVDYDAFWNEIQTTTSGLTYIPDRAVSVANARVGSRRLTHYTLSEEEATVLKNDPRVYCVEIPPSKRTDITIEPLSVQSSNKYDFAKVYDVTGNKKNWGLIRVKSKDNLYGNSTSINEDYLYTLDGKGVDVVIQDTGIQADHPEWLDNNGNSRLQQIDWYSEAGVAGTQPANLYTDYYGHGTHCAGIAAGRTFGFAKNARIYSQKLAGLKPSWDPNEGIPVEDSFDLIRLWHNAKSGSRPTVVNMSWGYGSYLSSGVDSITYRGTTHNSPTAESCINYGLPSVSSTELWQHNTRVDSVDVEIQEMIDDGIHVVMAAGNANTKCDINGGDDYNNYFTKSSIDYYYNRGGSPYDDEAIQVGSIDASVHDSNTDKKSTFSNAGPAVEIYAPGSYIVSACSNEAKSGWLTGSYFENSSYKQANVSGTSMAAPQVVGVIALLLQVNPTASPSSIKSSLLNSSGNALLEGASNDYSNDSTMGGDNNVLFNKFGNSGTPLEFNLPINANIFLK